MYCTGGIRCEKSTAYLKQKGFDQVYHLKGGILKYLESIPREDSRWNGECFVFDERVTVDHDLNKGNFDQCHACRHPITEADKQSEQYQQGVSCPHCLWQNHRAGSTPICRERKSRWPLLKNGVRCTLDPLRSGANPDFPLKICGSWWA